MWPASACRCCTTSASKHASARQNRSFSGFSTVLRYSGDTITGYDPYSACPQFCATARHEDKLNKNQTRLAPDHSHNHEHHRHQPPLPPPRLSPPPPPPPPLPATTPSPQPPPQLTAANRDRAELLTTPGEQQAVACCFAKGAYGRIRNTLLLLLRRYRRVRPSRTTRYIIKRAVGGISRIFMWSVWCATGL